MSKKEQVFEVISIFTLGMNLNCEKFTDLIFSDSSKSVVSAESVTVGYDYVHLDEHIYQVNLNLKSTYVNGVGEEVVVFQITQSGVFKIEQGSESEKDFMELAINVNCPSILLPYIRPIHNMMVAQNGVKPHTIGLIDFYDNYITNRNNTSVENDSADEEIVDSI